MELYEVSFVGQTPVHMVKASSIREALDKVEAIITNDKVRAIFPAGNGVKVIE